MRTLPQRCGMFVALVLLLLPASSAQGQEIPITTASDEARRLFLQGREKFYNLQLVTAAEVFDQAIGKDPAFALAHIYRALSGGGAAITQRHLATAVGLVDKVSPGERSFILALKANSEGDRAAYKKHLDDLVKGFPTDARVLSMIAFFYQGEGDLKAAIEWFKKTTEADPRFGNAYNALGYIYKTLGNYAESEASFKKYMEVAPGSPNPFDSYAELLLKMGRFDESVKYYRMAYEKDPTFTGPLGGIGFNLVHKGQFAQARESFEEQHRKSIQVNAKLTALANIVYSYLHEWDIPGALKATERYRMFAEKENPPNGVFANLMAGWIKVESGNPLAARTNLDAARSLNETVSLSGATKETNEVSMNVLECYMLMRSNDLPSAKRQAEKCRMMIEKRSLPAEKRTLHFLLGDLECELGNHAKALEHFDQGPIDNPGVMFSKAVAYERMGDKGKASEWYKKAANWNWTGLQYALVRAKAMKKLM